MVGEIWFGCRMGGGELEDKESAFALWFFW